MDLAQAVRDAKPNDTLKVPAGRYSVNLELTRPITIVLFLIAFGGLVFSIRRERAERKRTALS